MRDISTNSLDELKCVFEPFMDGHLFRGQTQDFSDDSQTGIRTSFDRHGCQPGLMLQWSHYARFALNLISQGALESPSIELTQAILQHYGWRSFYLDVSSSAGVASWFASNRWQGKRVGELVEDCFERPVFLRWFSATYHEDDDGPGFIYVIPKDGLEEFDLSVVPLDEIPCIDGCPRFQAQQASLIGSFQNRPLPKKCVTAKVSAPKAVLRELAAEAGITEAADLFPPKTDDPFLEALLSLPWLQLGSNSDGHIPVFTRSLEVPEYRRSVRKHMPPNAAFYNGSSVPRDSIPDIRFISVPNVTVFGQADVVAEEFPRVYELVRRYGRVAFEIETLTWLPESVTRGDFGKGLFLESCDDQVVSVSDLIVSWHGRELMGAGSNAGWHYKVDGNGAWERMEHQNDCPCENHWRHSQHLSVLTIIEFDLNQNPEKCI